MGPHYRTRVAIYEATAKAQNVAIMAADLTSEREDSFTRITVCATAAVKLQVKVGSTYRYLNGGSALTAATLHTFDVAIPKSFGAWNLSSDDGAGITVNYLVVQEIARAV